MLTNQAADNNFPNNDKFGRSLYSAMIEIKKNPPDKLFVRWDHPFTSNNAHLVGAAVTIAGLNENAVLFPQPDENIKLKDKEILLYWDANARDYKIKKIEGIPLKTPPP